MISVCMATVPGRERARGEAISSLVYQVDSLTVVDGSMVGDRAKFTNMPGDYIFTCDDDLIYPPDYIQTMISKIEQYDRRAVITCHGRTFRSHPIKSYYNSPIMAVHCLEDNFEDQEVEVPGTGVLAFHKNTIDISLDDFKSPNMADVWLALTCQKQGIKRIAIEHRKGWIRHSPYVDLRTTLARTCRNNDTKQTEAINSIKW